MRSYEVCGRLSNREYPVLKGERRGVENAGKNQHTSQKERKVESRYDIEVERDGVSISKDSVQQAFAKLKQGAKYAPELLADFEQTLYLNLDKKEKGK